MFGSAEATNIISAFILVATLAYVFLTWRITKSNKEMVEETRRIFVESRSPIISIATEIRQSVVIALVIENKGASAARKLRLSLDKDFYSFAASSPSRNIKNFNAFRKEIPSFSPGERLEFWLSQGFNLESEVDGKPLTPKTFIVSYDYIYNKKLYSGEVEIDVDAYLNSSHPKTEAESLADIAREMREMKDLVAAKIRELD